MALNIGEKKDVVKEISNIASSAQSAVAAEYRGLTVQELLFMLVWIPVRICKADRWPTVCCNSSCAAQKIS